jgi:sugar lactone lactonase YvrE
MENTRLFALLPEEYVCTPDGMEIDKAGNLIVSCPNYAQDDMPGCVIRIDKNRNISKWFDVPVHPETGIARNMGIAFDKEWNMYLCDNQGWSGRSDLAFKGRMLKVSFNEDGSVKEWHTVANAMEHPNGVRIYKNFMYVTQSYLTRVEDPSGDLVSCVYRFPLDAENLEVSNTLSDPWILTTFITHNPKCQYGADGIEIDAQGNLYVGNFGDGEVWKIHLDENGDMLGKEVYARDEAELGSTDGMIMDRNTGILYIADFNRNAIVAVTPDHRVKRLAQSPDCDGFHGELDQPGEPIIWGGRIIASCFDLVTDEGKVNTRHEMPATMAELDLLSK